MLQVGKLPSRIRRTGLTGSGSKGITFRNVNSSLLVQILRRYTSNGSSSKRILTRRQSSLPFIQRFSPSSSCSVSSRENIVSNVFGLSVARAINTSSPKDEKQHQKSESDSENKNIENVSTFQKTIVSLKWSVLNPRQAAIYGWEMTKEVASHYWLGTKLLWSEIKVARGIVGRLLAGHSMTRRERLQLVRTAMDIFRLVPFAIFVIVPFMEFLLPFALKLFPNMLPSTFQDSLKKEEDMKRELHARLEIAGFLKETLMEMANKKKENEEREKASKEGISRSKGEGVVGAGEILEFIDKAKNGDPLPNSEVLKIAKYFKDELTLANMARPQLVTLCQYMGIKPFGADAFLRFQLRTKLRGIKEDDRRILWEGIESLTLQELREACQERGMRAIGLGEHAYRIQLRQWLELSIEKSIPISLLIMSRAFSLSLSPSGSFAGPMTKTEKIISSISSLDDDVINEVVLAAARPSEENTVDMKKRKIESVMFQKELIEDEREDTDEAKEKENKEKEKHLEREKKERAMKEREKKDASSSVEAPSEPVHLNDKSSQSTFASQSSSSVQTMKAGDTHQETIPQHPPVSALEETSFVDEEDEVVSKKKQPELTLAEMEVLGDMARSSAVEREKIQLRLLKAELTVSDLADVAPVEPPKIKKEVESALSSDQSLERNKDGEIVIGMKPGEAVYPESVKDIGRDMGIMKKITTLTMVKNIAVDAKSEHLKDNSLSSLRSALDKWISKLEVRIESTEKALGDKLQMLDKDGDGELNTEELKDVVQRVLRHPTPEEAEMLVQMLDKDKDGVVSVVDLLQYVETKKEKLEVEAFESRISGKSDN